MAASKHVDATDLTLTATKEQVVGERAAMAFSVSAQWVRNSTGLRFDASHFNPRLARAVAALRSSGMDLQPLGSVTQRVFIPSRFKRVYVARAHGVPFLQGSHITQSDPADIKYISPAVHTDIDQWLIREGWLLVTRSGTVGRVALTPKTWDGWAASEHLLRIVPDSERCPPGYLYAFLRSFAGQAQLTSHIYGAVVDELTEDQTRAVLVPIPKTAKQRRTVAEIDLGVLEAVGLQEQAVKLGGDALGAVERLVGTED